MSKLLSGVELTVFDSKTNKSVVLSGDLELTFDDIQNITTSAVNVTTGANYDQEGALKYVVAVLLVYSLSIIFLILALTRRKAYSKSLDSEITCYMKGLESARQQAKQEEVLRMRLKWPGNFIELRNGSRLQMNNISPSDVEDYPEWPCLHSVQEESPYSSDEDFVEIPARTVSNMLDNVPPYSAHDIFDLTHTLQIEENTFRHTDSISCMHAMEEQITHTMSSASAAPAVLDMPDLDKIDIDFPKYYKHRVPRGRMKTVGINYIPNWNLVKNRKGSMDCSHQPAIIPKDLNENGTSKNNEIKNMSLESHFCIEDMSENLIGVMQQHQTEYPPQMISSGAEQITYKSHDGFNQLTNNPNNKNNGKIQRILPRSCDRITDERLNLPPGVHIRLPKPHENKFNMDNLHAGNTKFLQSDL